MQLRHYHLSFLSPYPLTCAIQEILIQRHLDYHHPPPTKDPDLSKRPSPEPSLLTFTTFPTFTTGRRQTLTPSQIEALTSPTPIHPFPASYYASQRGGLLTYHGPGQLTAYPILHLRSHGLTPRTYVRQLESTVIGTLAAHGTRGFTRDKYPGVWVGPHEKLASVGVHVRRGVAGFGTGLNVWTEPEWWARGTACGIEGVKIVGLKERGVEGVEDWKAINLVAREFAGQLASRLEGVDGVHDVDPAERDLLVEAARRKMLHEALAKGEEAGDSKA